MVLRLNNYTCEDVGSLRSLRLFYPTPQVWHYCQNHWYMDSDNLAHCYRLSLLPLCLRQS